ncbi:13241_t:CDS:1, partial [Dentiscutata heterogama]
FYIGFCIVNDFQKGGPSYKSAEAIMNEKLEYFGEKSRPTSSHHGFKAKPLRSNSM